MAQAEAEETGSASERVRVRRHPDRGHYDRKTVYAILDSGIMCHVAYVDEGEPRMIPTLYARCDDVLYLHGAAASAMLLALGKGGMACVTVTHLDGLVLAKSIYNHSANYRSAVVFGHPEDVRDSEEKNAALRAMVDRMVPGRWDDCREPSATELKATRVVRVPIEEASAKIRTGGASDAEKDLSLRYWAGVVPMALTSAAPVADDGGADGLPIPEYLLAGRRSGG